MGIIMVYKPTCNWGAHPVLQLLASGGIIWIIAILQTKLGKWAWVPFFESEAITSHIVKYHNHHISQPHIFQRFIIDLWAPQRLVQHWFPVKWD